MEHGVFPSGWFDLLGISSVTSKGGLGFVVVVSEIFFSGISGSSIADASAIGALLLPSMVKAGYAPRELPPSSRRPREWE